MVIMDGVDSENAAQNPYSVPSVPKPAKDALSRDYAMHGGWSSSLGERVKVRRDKDAVVLEFKDFSDGSEGSPEHVESLVFTLTRMEDSSWPWRRQQGQRQWDGRRPAGVGHRVGTGTAEREPAPAQW